MNDATRELGAALGVAVLGSIAASKYGSGISSAIAPLAPADQAAARTSLGAALQAASHLPSDVAAHVTSAANEAFVSGIHLAAFAGACLAACAAMLVWRFLPHRIAQHGALASAAAAAEDTAELALAGVPPVFADVD
jgi:DHA2 family multidrug resistance protein-like MFS transporter